MTLTPFSFIQVIQLSQGGQGNNTNVISVFMLNHGVNDVGVEKRSIFRISFLGSIYKISFKKMIKESIKSRLYCVGPKFSERHRIYALFPLMSLDLCPHALPSLICAISPRQCWISHTRPRSSADLSKPLPADRGVLAEPQMTSSYAAQKSSCSLRELLLLLQLRLSEQQRIIMCFS